MLELVGVCVRDRDRVRLDRCGFAVRPGEVLGLVGPTGAGKTSALEVAAGLRAPDRGRVLLDGRDVTRRPARLRAAAGLLMPPFPGPHEQSAAAWLRLWAELDGVPRAERAGWIAEAAERFELTDALDVPVAALSRGRRRALELARLWARRPTLYLLDGPDEGLDGHGLRRLSTALRALATDGATVLLTAAAPHLPTAVCDRVVCLEAGTVSGERARRDADFADQVAAAQGWQA